MTMVMSANAEFVVVAAERRPGPPVMRSAGERRRREDDAAIWQPVGTRHAVLARAAWGAGTRATLCGLPADSWHVWTDITLDGRSGGDCRRCAQLMTAEHRGPG